MTSCEKSHYITLAYFGGSFLTDVLTKGTSCYLSIKSVKVLYKAAGQEQTQTEFTNKYGEQQQFLVAHNFPLKTFFENMCSAH